MQVSTVFHISVYCLVMLAAVMLAVAEGAAVPQGLTIPLAFLAMILVERWRVLKLSAVWTNILGVLALLLAVAEAWGLGLFGVVAFRAFSGEGEPLPVNLETRLLAGSHFLVFLTWIILLQRKQAKQFWWLCALSVLQVAVGSVLMDSELYGLLMLAFMFLAVWTLSVFSLYQAQQQFQSAESAESSPALPPPDEPQQRASGSRARHGFRGLALWKLRLASMSRGSIQLDTNQRWLGGRFLVATAGTALMAIFVSACFFLLIPRLWAGHRPLQTSSLRLVGRPVSGFSTQVRLGDLGSVLQSSARVLEIRLFDHKTNKELDVNAYIKQLGYEEPLFRGVSLGDYRHGRWTTLARHWRGVELPPVPETGAVRQEIHLEPLGSDFLIGIQPAMAGHISNVEEPIVIHTSSANLHRPQDLSTGQVISYTLHSPLTAAERRSWEIKRGLSHFRRPSQLRVYLNLPGREFARLRELAHQVAGYQSEDDHPPAAEMARKLRHYLRDSEEFEYSLTSTVQDRTVDIVVDFLFNRKSGHCEYFASALALMLRAVDIPSRLVTGFKGGVRNKISGHFEIEQRHAHAWVEAFIDGRWQAIDATPAAREQSVESFNPPIRAAHDLASFVQSSWSRYVVNMDIDRQSVKFYEPFLVNARRWWAERTRGGLSTNLSVRFRRALSDFNAGFRWSWAIVGLVSLAVVAAILYAVRRSGPMRRLLRALFPRRRDRDDARIEFYERFRKVCAALGLVRRPSQTQREFAEEVRWALSDRLSPHGLVDFPAQLADSFYQVRFGAMTLDDRQTARMNEQLARLESSLSNGKNGRS